MSNNFNVLRDSVNHGLISKSHVEKAYKADQINNDQRDELIDLCETSKVSRASEAVKAADRDFRGLVSRANLGGYLTIGELTEKGVTLTAKGSRATTISPKQIAKFAASYRNLFAAMASAMADDQDVNHSPDHSEDSADDLADVTPISAAG